MEPNNTQPGFFARLKQHHLYTVVVVYAVVAGFVVQFASRALPAFGWGGAFPAIIIVLIVGFPVAVVLAWTLVNPKDPAKYGFRQRLHWKFGVSISVLVLAAAVASGFFAWRLDQSHVARLAAEQANAKPAAPAFNPPADSLVVLPFKNLNGDPKQQYFSDGITEELTDVLGQIPALRVIAWDTASRLRDSTQSAAEIGMALNVANLLHGSIEREGNQVRITVELVDTRSGLQLWSQHYDDTFADIFKVQDQVSESISGALKVKFAQASPPADGTAKPEAHDLVLKGRALMDMLDVANLAAAQHDFEQAIALDPNYADAHALLSHTLLRLNEVSDQPLKSALPTIRAEAEKAIVLDPNNTDAWVALGLADSNSNPPDLTEARADFQKALKLDPSNANAHIDYGLVLPLKEDRAQQQQATMLDPANEIAWVNLGGMYLSLGDWTQAISAADTLLKLDPQDVYAVFYLAFAHLQLHQYDKMVAAFDLVKPLTPVDADLFAAGRLTYQTVRNPALRPQALAALKSLARHQNNSIVAFNLLQLYLVLGETQHALQMLENICVSLPAFCVDLDADLMLRPLRGNPRFEALAKKYTSTIQD